MALREAGIRLTLQGAAEYKAGLKGVSQEIRTMATESKLALAQLGNNASITDTYNTRMKSLGNEIKLTSDKTRMFSDRQRDLTKSQDEITKSIEKTTASYKTSQEQTKKLKDEYDKLVESQGKNSKEAKEARAEWKESEKATNALKKELNQLEVAYNSNSKELAKMPNELAKAELATQRLRNEAQKLHEEYRNQGGRLADTAKAWQDFGSNLVTAGGHMTKVGDWATQRFTVPIVTGLGLAVGQAKTFQSEMGAMLPLIAEGGNITAEHRNQVEQLGNASRTMAIEYGQYTSDLNSGMAELIRNGYNSSQVLGMMPNVLDASIASGEEFGVVMSTTANVLSQFQLKGESTNETLANTQRVVDSLTYVANATSSGFYDLGQGMAYVGPVANTLNMSVEETASILGILSDNGIEASQGGTALRGALTRLLKPSKQNAEAMAELGISVEDYKNGLIDFPTILDTIAENTKNLTDEQKAALIAQAFGTESQSAMNALVSAGGDALRDMTDAAKGATGATKEIADAIKETPQFKFDQSLAQLRDVGIELGSKLLPHVTNAISMFGEWVHAFNELDDSTQNFIIKAGLVTAAVGPIIGTLGRLTTATGHVVTGVGKAIKAFGKWTTPKSVGETVGLMGSLGSVTPLAVAGLGLVAGAYLYLNSEAGKAHQRMQEFPDISGLTEAQAESLRQVSDEVTTIKTELDTLDTATNFSNLNGNIQGLGTEIQTLNDEKIKKLREDFEQLPLDVQEALSGALEQTVANIEAQTDRVQTVMDEINRLTAEGLDENGVLQDAYQIQVKNLTDELMSYYSLSLSENADQQREIYQSLTADISEMTESQLEDRIRNLTNSIDQEKELYQNQQDTLFEMWKNNAISEEEYYNTSNQLAEAHQSRLDALNQERIKSEVEMLDRLLIEMEKQGIDTERAYRENMERIAEQYGLTMEELETIANSVDLTEPIKNMVDYADEASPQLKTAVNEWNGAILEFAKSAGKSIEELNQQDLQTFIDNIEQTDLSWSDLQLLTKEANIDDNTKDLINAAAEAQGGWDAVIFAEKNAEVNVMGMEELQALIEMFGFDFASLTDEQKEALINANGAKELSDLMVEYGIWKADSPAEAKRAAVDADPALSAFKELFIAQGWWEDATFPGKIADVDTNKEDFMDDLAQIVSEWSGIPVDEIKQMLIETNAEDTTRELGTIGGAVEDLNGRQIIIKTREDGSTYIKGDLSTLKQTAEEVDGTTATVYANANGVGESASAMIDFNTQADAMPTEKSSSIKSNVFSTAANTIALLAYNAAVGAMTDKSVEASTSTPSMLPNTLLVLGYNSAVDNMTNKSSTLTTSAPGIVANTVLAWGWISALNSAYDRTSTLTTNRVTRYSTIGISPRGYKDGGHIDAYADGGNIKWGGMFANGGNVPQGYMGIVGEAGPELFHVTKSGVSITPLASNEKMRGVEGAIEDYMQGKGSGGGDSYAIDINISDVTIRDDRDIDKLTDSISERLVKQMQRDKKMRKGSVVGFG